MDGADYKLDFVLYLVTVDATVKKQGKKTDNFFLGYKGFRMQCKSYLYHMN